ncbi:MAG: hypothetical protein RQ982_08370, partial [Gammaproteobacteria bacterium]|nr:hypothetical protein [Gammaproteobacteria bacterium]
MLKNYQKNEFLFQKQVEPLFRATASGAFANIVAAFLAYALLHNTQHQIDGFLICSGIIFFSIIRLFIAKSYLSKNKPELKKHLYSYLILTLIIGIFWGLYAFMLRQPEDESVRYICYLINFGLISGSIATLSTYKLAYIVYVWPQSVAIIAVFLIIDTASGPYIAMTLFLSTIFMMMM